MQIKLGLSSLVQHSYEKNFLKKFSMKDSFYTLSLFLTK